MANLVETAEWVDGIYQLETIDPVQGGPEGIDNLQAKQLANRTKYLKSLVDSLGTNKQPLDATLTALAALVTAADKLVYATGADTFATTSLTAFARTLLDDVDAATMRGTLGAAPLASPGLTGTPTAPTAVAGTNTTQLATTAFVAAAVAALVDASPTTLNTLNELAAALGDDPNFATTITTALGNKQPLDATLTALAALTTAANKLIYATGADTFGTTDLTAFARTLLDDADAASVRATLLLNSGLSTSFTSSGYFKFPDWLGGFIFQWAWLSTVTSGNKTWTFPIAFQNACFHASGIVGASTGGDYTDRTLLINSISLTNAAFGISANGAADVRGGASNFMVFSIGY